MNVLIERDSRKSILPAALDALISVKGAKTFCEQYNPPKRPPLGIYNVSLGKVLNNFEYVLDALDFILRDEPYRDETKYSSNFANELLKNQEALIKSIQEYFDGCKDTLRCFYPASIGSKQNKFNKEPIINTYWQAVKDDFFKPISEIANHIKHDEGRLVFFVMFNDRYAIPGYFVESVDLQGRVGPYRKIHQPFYSQLDPMSGYDTAFSFFRDLRYLLWGIYFVSHHLAEAILTKNGLTQATHYAPFSNTDSKMINIANRISQLPKRFYSDELKKNIPYVCIVEQEANTLLKLEYPSDQLLISLDGSYDNLIVLIGDGVSKSFRIPYKKGKL